MLKRETTVVALALASTLGLAPVAPADEAHPVCRLLLAQERIERDDLALDVELAESELGAYEEIFALLDGLWKNDALERLAYLEGKHDRDISKLRRDLRVLLLERQDALIEQYRLLCGAEASQQAHDRAHERYLKSECDRLTKQVEMAQVDLEFTLVQQESVLDLRANAVATRQQVIFAEVEVAYGRQQLADSERRVRECRAAEKTPQPGHTP